MTSISSLNGGGGWWSAETLPYSHSLTWVCVLSVSPPGEGGKGISDNKALQENRDTSRKKKKCLSCL